MESKMFKIYSPINKNVALKVIPGHFATNHSHINYYVDMTTLKARQSEAEGVAQVMARKYESTTVVDTIICMDGCEVIGAYLAEELTHSGIMCMNQHKTIYVVTPEFNANGQLIFRDNTQFMIENKNVLLLVASVTTGRTIERSLDCIDYYGGHIRGVSAIFSATNKVRGIEVNAAFTDKDLDHYENYEPNECPHCKANKRIEAIVNSYGYSKI